MASLLYTWHFNNLFSLNNVNCLYWTRKIAWVQTRTYSLNCHVHTVIIRKERNVYAFKCAKCDSLSHIQWANVFHCWNVVSIFLRCFCFCSSCILLSYSFYISFYYVSFLVLHTYITHSVLCQLMRSLSACSFIIWVSLSLLFLSFHCVLCVCAFFYILIDCIVGEHFAILSRKLTLDIEIFKWNNAFNVYIQKSVWVRSRLLFLRVKRQQRKRKTYTLKHKDHHCLNNAIAIWCVTSTGFSILLLEVHTQTLMCFTIHK